MVQFWAFAFLGFLGDHILAANGPILVVFNGSSQGVCCFRFVSDSILAANGPILEVFNGSILGVCFFWILV